MRDLLTSVPPIVRNARRLLADADLPAAIEKLVEAYARSGEAQIIERAAAGILDATKQLGHYVDDWFIERDLTHEGFDEGDAKRARNEARRALHLLRDVEKLSLARVLFLSDPVAARLKTSRKAIEGLCSSRPT